ncbi:MAG TPA: 2'-5' RNA ligase family protein [Chitinophagaceae bacterium]|jgi:2'-5' RNA ligase|nr:2'-5' RNA ligase family protein [Chitinophagaceae bacterium]
MANMYFIALVLPTEINEEILKWKLFMKDHFNCQVALRSPAHITLVPPFWMSDNLENELKNAITNFSRSKAPFEVHLKNFAAFKPRVIYADVLSNPTLQTLQAQLFEYLIAQDLFPVKQDDRPFHAHVTIASRDLHKKAFSQAWEVFKNKNYDVKCMTVGVSLLKHNQKNWDVIFTSQFQTS